MVTACINIVGMSPENLLDCPPAYPSQGWIGPRIPFGRDMMNEDGKNAGEKPNQEDSVVDFVDFEFRLSDPVAMLTADELFSNGKLVPLQLAPIQTAVVPQVEVRTPASIHSQCKEKISKPDYCACSPKAPRCSSRWKEILGLKKAQSREAERMNDAHAISKLASTKSLKHYLSRNAMSSSIDSTLISCPLLRDSDSESLSISARASLSSSSSSGADHDDLPRLSLDLDRINSTPPPLPPRAKVAKARSAASYRPVEFSGDGNAAIRIVPNLIRRAPESAVEVYAAWRARRNPMHFSTENGEIPAQLAPSVDSPRLNASGKVIFQGLGRSSSSPSFNGGPRPRPRGMERSYSANVRVTPVLNVPVCNLRGTAKSVSAFGLGQIFLPQKREKENCAAKNATGNLNGATTKT